MSDHEQNTRRLLLTHAERYPMAQVQDYMKYLYQSSFGCEHLIDDPSAAAAYIRREAETAVPHPGEALEPLDGPYCRVHLDILKNGLSPDTFAMLFACSAEHHEDGIAVLEEKLDVLQKMTDAGELPLDASVLRTQLTAWQKAGYPACHHSQTFREAYAPAYRLMKEQYARYLPLFAAIDRRMQTKEKATVVIDGMCAGGKSTLAELLGRVYGCTVFHMDDYFLRPEQRTPERYAEPGGNVDRERFLEEILVPLRAGQPVCFRRFNCATMALEPAEYFLPTPLTVIEGSYSLHPELRDPDQLSVFLSVDPEEQMRRIIGRNGAEYAKVFEERWIPLEQAYFDALQPQRGCEIVFHA